MEEQKTVNRAELDTEALKVELSLFSQTNFLCSLISVL